MILGRMSTSPKHGLGHLHLGRRAAADSSPRLPGTSLKSADFLSPAKVARLNRYAQSTQQCWWGVLTSYFQRAVDRDKIQRSPFVGRRRPRGEPEMPTPALTRQQAQRLLDSLTADFGHPDRDLIARRDYALISTLLFMCLRCSELTSLTWQSIRRDRGKLS
jgi:integrase